MYKLFKKNESKIKFLQPLTNNNKLKVCKIITESDVNMGYNEDALKYIEINQCPRLTVNSNVVCKNIETNKNEDIGKLVDIEFNEDLGYLLVFENG